MDSATISIDEGLLDPEQEHVFRDFERSKIDRIRAALAQDNGLVLGTYVFVVLFWTVMMSYGSSIHGDGQYAINLAPHVSHFTLILGIFLFPLRKIAIPIVTYGIVYLLPFGIPFFSKDIWFNLESLTLGLSVTTFALHVIGGTIIGILARGVAYLMKPRFSPYLTDLYTIISVFFLFILVSIAQVHITLWMVSGLPHVALRELGYDADFLHRAMLRILRGGVVVAAFLMAVLEAPNRSEATRGLMMAALFPLLALVQSYGWSMYPMLDATILALLLVITCNLSVGLFGGIVGIPLYSALTGHFLVHGPHISKASVWLENYSIIGLMCIVLVVALRGVAIHTSRDRRASLRRLSMVRDFANVGLVSFNLDQDRFRADHAAQRMLQVPSTGAGETFISLFDEDDRVEVLNALANNRHRSLNLMLHMRARNAEGQQKIARMFLWYERAPSGDKMAYGLVLDMTVEHQQERMLQETLLELSTKQERQRQLFSIVSHELRTPASVVSMLLDELNDPSKRDKVQKQLRDATDQLLSTLADMRQTVNPTQNLPVKLVPYSPFEVAESIRNMFQPQAKENQTTIVLDMGSKAEQSRIGDMVRIKQALSNLVRNAIIHSKGTEVTLSYTSRIEPGQTRPISVWRVQDNGVGIADDEVERLFQPFERGGTDPRKHADGSGLGLFIAKSSIETLGGSIVFFRPSGGGAGYLIETPEALASDDECENARKKPDVMESEVYPQIRILLAEDNQLVAEVTQAKLSRFVGTVDVAGNGREALERLIENPPDLLITDLFMPEMDGDELVRTLRLRGYTLPIVGLTAAVVGDDMDRLKEAGADVVMTKPIDMRHLRRLVADLAAKNAAIAS